MKLPLKIQKLETEMDHRKYGTLRTAQHGMVCIYILLYILRKIVIKQNQMIGKYGYLYNYIFVRRKILIDCREIRKDCRIVIVELLFILFRARNFSKEHGHNFQKFKV